MKMRKCCLSATVAALMLSGLPLSGSAQTAAGFVRKYAPAAGVGTDDPAAVQAPVRDSGYEPSRSAGRSAYAGLKASMRSAAAGKATAENGPWRTVSAAMPVHANVIYDNTWGYSKKYNVSSIAFDGTFTQIAQDYDLNGNGGAVYIDGKYYVISYTQYGSTRYASLYVYDTETWTYSYDEGRDFDNSSIATDLTYDATTGNVYGCFYGEDTSTRRFGTIAFPSGEITTIRANLPVNWNAIACDNQGQLFAIDNNGDLFKVSKTDGELTLVGSTGLKPYYTTSATFDPRTGRFYYALSPEDNSGKLYEINPATAEATLLCEFDHQQQLAGMWVPLPLAEDEAPAAVTEITPSFEGGALAGTVDFTAPAVSFVGEMPLTGELGYKVTIVGETTETFTGTTTPGALTKAPVTVPAAGRYEIRVTTSNDFGDSPLAKTSGWIGNDVPKDVKNVAFSYADGKAALTWDAATDGVNGGYIDPAAVVYTVTRYPGEVVVADKISANSFEETLAEPEALTTYYYTVSAEFGGVTTAATASNRVTLGKIIPPYLQDFDDSKAIEVFTTIDNDGDGRNWAASSGAVRSRYRSKGDTDNWLITPQVSLKGNMQYTLTFDYKSNSARYCSTMAVFFGTAPTPDGMTVELLDKTVVTNNSYEQFSATVTVETDGVYYFAVQDCSDNNGDYLWVDNLAVSAGLDVRVPAAVTGLKAVPDYNGGTSVSLSCVLPTLNIGGEALEAISKVEVLRDGEAIHTATGVQPGASFAYTDNDAALTKGYHVYTVTAYSEAGAGTAAEVKAYAGINVPAEPQAVNLVETSVPGEVTLSWEAPAVDVDGNALNPEFLSYMIMGIENGQAVIIEDNYKGNSWTAQAVSPDADEQEFVVYGVSAVTEGGYSDPVVSPIVPVGPAYSLPLAESFANTAFTLQWSPEVVSGKGYWQINDETTFSTMGSSDGDAGYLCYRASTQGETARLMSGKIDLVKASNPTLTFYYHPLSGSTNEISVVGIDAAGEKTLHTFCIADGEGVWDKVTVDLSPMAGSVCRIGIEVSAKLHLNTSVDQISIADVADYEVAAAGISVLPAVQVGKPFEVSVSVENRGANPAENVAVDLYLNDKLVATENIAAIAPAAVENAVFAQNLDIHSPETLVYYAVVRMTGDTDAANNTTDKVTSTLAMPRLAWVTDLAATAADGGVKLSWSEPMPENMPSQAVTEDFEAYPTYAIDNIGDWTMIDRDGLQTSSADGLSYPNANSPKAFMVFGDKEELPIESFRAHSGEHYMACFSSNPANDDWLISPELIGKAQTVSFYAKSYVSQYGLEEIEMLYTLSADATDINSYVKVGETENVPAMWTLYEFDVPAGTRHIAIRCVSANHFILFIDDVTFIPAVVDEAELIGYNVYRNGEKVNAAPVTDAAFTDAEGKEGDSYFVTAVYAEGESRHSNEVMAATSGVDGIAAGGITVKGEAGRIVVGGADGREVAVYGVDGIVFFHGVAKGDVTVDVVPGLYIVVADSVTAKVRVP